MLYYMSIWKVLLYYNFIVLRYQKCQINEYVLYGIINTRNKSNLI